MLLQQKSARRRLPESQRKRGVQSIGRKRGDGGETLLRELLKPKTGGIVKYTSTSGALAGQNRIKRAMSAPAGRTKLRLSEGVKGDEKGLLTVGPAKLRADALSRDPSLRDIDTASPTVRAAKLNAIRKSKEILTARYHKRIFTSTDIDTVTWQTEILDRDSRSDTRTVTNIHQAVTRERREIRDSVEVVVESRLGRFGAGLVGGMSMGPRLKTPGFEDRMEETPPTAPASPDSRSNRQTSHTHSWHTNSFENLMRFEHDVVEDSADEAEQGPLVTSTTSGNKPSFRSDRSWRCESTELILPNRRFSFVASTHPLFWSWVVQKAILHLVHVVRL